MDIRISFDKAGEHASALRKIEKQIRASFSKRKGDPLESFNWFYSTYVEHDGGLEERRPLNERIHAHLVAKSRGICWSSKLTPPPLMCLEYWA